jgi:uncharacterized protein
MTFATPPTSAAWQHRGARDGCEVAFLRLMGNGLRVEGHTTAVENGVAWTFGYMVVVDTTWATRGASAAVSAASGQRELTIASDGRGTWRIDGAEAPWLDGCLDLDLEASAFTNALPVHRLGLGVGEEADAPAAWVRVADLAVERLEQRYARIEDDGPRQRFDYSAPGLDFHARLVFDESGLVLDYPGIATRAPVD